MRAKKVHADHLFKKIFRLFSNGFKNENKLCIWAWVQAPNSLPHTFLQSTV